MAETFPASPVPAWPMVISPRWHTIISDFDSGAEQRRKKSLYAVYDVSLQFPPLASADVKILWEFYQARKGAYEAFYYYDPRPGLGMVISHDGLYVGTGDGSTSTFDLGGTSTSSRSIYLNGAVQSSGFSYLTGGGDGSSDRVSFTSAPSSGAIITCDFTGSLRMRVRFAQDNLDFSLFQVLLSDIGIKFKGLWPA